MQKIPIKVEGRSMLSLFINGKKLSLQKSKRYKIIGKNINIYFSQLMNKQNKHYKKLNK